MLKLYNLDAYEKNPHAEDLLYNDIHTDNNIIRTYMHAVKNHAYLIAIMHVR